MPSSSYTIQPRLIETEIGKKIQSNYGSYTTTCMPTRLCNQFKDRSNMYDVSIGHGFTNSVVQNSVSKSPASKSPTIIQASSPRPLTTIKPVPQLNPKIQNAGNSIVMTNPVTYIPRKYIPNEQYPIQNPIQNPIPIQLINKPDHSSIDWKKFAKTYIPIIVIVVIIVAFLAYRFYQVKYGKPAIIIQKSNDSQSKQEKYVQDMFQEYHRTIKNEDNIFKTITR